MPNKPKSKPRAGSHAAPRKMGTTTTGAKNECKDSRPPAPNGQPGPGKPLNSNSSCPEAMPSLVKSLKTGEVYHRFYGDMLPTTGPTNLVVLYGPPLCGKTTFFQKTMEDIEEYAPWMEFIKLKDVALWLSADRKPRSLIEFCAKALCTSVKSMKKKFQQPIPKEGTQLPIEATQQHLPPSGEIFMDGLDEMDPPERELFLTLLLQHQDKRESPKIRIWLSARSHLKPKLEPFLGVDSSFEIVGYTYDGQVKLIAGQIDKIMFPDVNDKDRDDIQLRRISDFAESLHADLVGLIKGFGETIGSCPSILQAIAAEVVKDDPKTAEYSLVDRKGVKDVMEVIAQEFHKSFIKKFRTCGPFRNVHDIVQVALQTVYSFEAEPRSETIDEELLSLGFIVREDGVLKFINECLANFWLARYFSDYKRKIYIRCEYHFFHGLLFEKDAFEFRVFLEAFLTTNGGSPSILLPFMVDHYKLGEGMEKEWEKIKDEGTVFHLALMEGFHNIAKFILHAFCRHMDGPELKNFLSIRAPVVIERKPFGVRTFEEPTTERHLLSTLSMLALFGSGIGTMDCYFETYKAIFKNAEIYLEFDVKDQWTPLHYAAVNSNLWFIEYLITFAGIKPKAGVFNPRGELAQHLLMCYSWAFSMVLSDHGYATSNSCQVSSSTANETKEGGSVNGESQEQPHRPREACVYQYMAKDLVGADNELRLVHHRCLHHLIITIGDDVDAVDKDKMTVLHYAAKQGPLETVQYLVSCLGADTSVVNSENFKPVDIARRNKQSEIITYLLEVMLQALIIKESLSTTSTFELDESQESESDALEESGQEDDEREQEIENLPTAVGNLCLSESQLSALGYAKRSRYRDSDGEEVEDSITPYSPPPQPALDQLSKEGELERGFADGAGPSSPISIHTDDDVSVCSCSDGDEL